jgi:hypothetical protein
VNRYAVGLGPAFLVLVCWLNLLRLEPFATWFYLFAWFGVVLTADQLIRRREGRSLVTRCGAGGFVLVLIGSATTWYFFELLNLRLENWYYVFVTDGAVRRTVGTLLSFATVFPGILWIDHYLTCRDWPGPCHGPRLFQASASGRRLQLAGGLCLLLPMVWPRFFFPLVWVSTGLLLAPVELRAGQGLLTQLRQGDYGPLRRTLVAGLIAGLCWESLNFWARAKWIYTVPFFDRLKLFEMPLAGFLGFPPFAVECTVLYRVLVHLRLAPAFGVFAGARQVLADRRRTVAAVALGLTFSLVVDQAVVAPTVIQSVSPRAERATWLDPATRQALTDCGAEYLTSLEGWQAEARWQCLDAKLPPADLVSLRQNVALCLHQGIGVEYTALLVRAGLRAPGDLARWAPEGLDRRLNQVAMPGERLPRLAQLRVWIRRAGQP